IAGDDTTKLGKPASYTIAMTDSLSRSLRVDAQSSIYLSIAPTDAKPGPRTAAKDSTKKDSTKSKPKRPESKKDEKDTTTIDDIGVSAIDPAFLAQARP